MGECDGNNSDVYILTKCPLFLSLPDNAHSSFEYHL